MELFQPQKSLSLPRVQSVHAEKSLTSPGCGVPCRNVSHLLRLWGALHKCLSPSNRIRDRAPWNLSDRKTDSEILHTKHSNVATVSRRLHNKAKKVINQNTSKIWEHEIESQNLRTHTEVDQKNDYLGI